MTRLSTRTAAARATSRPIVLVGGPGAGKTTIGRLLAERLNVPFADSDVLVEQDVGMTIPEIFTHLGEATFRACERRAVAKALERMAEGGVLATGGGAFIDAETRALIRAQGTSVWLRASPDLLVARVGRKRGRPLLETDAPETTLRQLLADRYPIYAEADVTVETGDHPRERTVEAVLDRLAEARSRAAE